MTRLSSKSRRALAAVLAVVAVLGVAVTNAPRLGLLGVSPITMFPVAKPQAHPPLVAVFLSGDMGFHFGMGGKIVAALVEHDVPVVGVSTPVAFANHRSRAETDAIVANAIRYALENTGAQKIVLMGQSFGADIVSTVAPDLPADLRAHIVAVDLTVPAPDVFFRADPSTIAYMGTPDAYPLQPLRAMRGVPVVCVYGLEEKSSLCPGLRGTGAQVIGLTGDHHLKHDPERLVSTTLAALRRALPGVPL